MDAAVIAGLLEKQTQVLLRENAAVVARAVADAEKRLAQKLDGRVDKIEGAVEQVWDKYRTLQQSQSELQEEVLSLRKAVEALAPPRERLRTRPHLCRMESWSRGGGDSGKRELQTAGARAEGENGCGGVGAERQELRSLLLSREARGIPSRYAAQNGQRGHSDEQDPGGRQV